MREQPINHPLTSGSEENKNEQADAHHGGDTYCGSETHSIQGDSISGGTVNKATFHGPVTGPVHTGSGDITYIDVFSLLRAGRRWFEDTLRLADAPEHMRTSWAGWLIYILRQLTNGLTAQHWWTLIVTVTLWVATAWLVTTILQWPLVESTRGRACVLYAIATLIMPTFVALTAPTDRQAEMKLDTRSSRSRLWLLKLAGAHVGFALTTAAIFIAVIVYYLGGTLPRGAQWLLVLIGLGFSHIGARRIPADRLKMYGELRLHEVDRLAMVVYLLIGPGVAAFIYWGYDVISNPGIGLPLLIGLTALALWEVRQRRREAFADWVLIAILGLLLPLAFFLFIFYFAMPATSPSVGEWTALVIVMPYLLGESMLVATLFVRNPPTLTIRGVMGLLAILLLLTYVLSVNLWVGRWVTVAVILLWLVWGIRRFRFYLWVHPSFWWLQLAVGGSIYW